MSEMHYLIPPTIYHAYTMQQSRGSLRAASLFLDISGFTQLTTQLMTHDKEGAEQLNLALNSIFDPLINTIYARGGFVAYFEGDALTALFPVAPTKAKEAVQNAALTALYIQRFFREQGTVKTRFGEFPVSAKIGLGSGNVAWRIIHEGAQHRHVFYGHAIDSSTLAEKVANKTEIKMTAAFARWLMPTPNSDFVQLEESMLSATPSVLQVTLPTPQRDILSNFVPDIILNTDPDKAGEFRNVAAVFIGTDAGYANDAWLDFGRLVLGAATTYGGYFNKIVYGDKGNVIVVLFGAPAAYGNTLNRAANFLIALRRLTPPLNWRSGLSLGTAYAGFVGGQRQREYTALGDTINLAARLMGSAVWGEDRVPSALVRNMRGHQFVSLGGVDLKGIETSVEVSRLVGSALTSDEFPSLGLIGREAELATLDNWLAPLEEGHFAGVMTIYGEAGIGKSRLAAELRQRYMATHTEINWFMCQADTIVPQAFSPFRYFLKNYFVQTTDLALNRYRFETTLTQLAESLPPPTGEPATDLKSELEQGRSFLASLIDIYDEGSLYEQVESRLRFENTLAALKTLFLAESLRKPTIIHIDDAHVLDEASLAALARLTRQIEAYPLAILLTSRLNQDDTHFTISLDDDVKPAPASLMLESLDAEAVSAMAEQVLGGVLTDALKHYLVDRTTGNALFVEQLTLDLRERGALQFVNESWDIIPQMISNIPFLINDIMIARLDRLTAQVKEVVHNAAVVGREFEVQLLSAMLRDAANLSEHIQQAENNAIWIALSAIRHLFRFKHPMLRDTAYEMQSRARLRELHMLAATGIEQVYKAQLASHYGDLVYHFKGAEQPRRELHYARLAGDHAAAAYQNSDAINYFNRALELAPSSDFTARYETLLAREAVYHLQGERELQRADLVSLDALGQQLPDQQRAEIAMRWGRYHEAISEFGKARDYAEQAVKLGQQASDVKREIAALYLWGNSLSNEGRMDEASIQLNRGLELARAGSFAEQEAIGLRGLAGMHLKAGNPGAAEPFLNDAQKHFTALGHPPSEGNLEAIIATQKARQGNLQEGIALLEEYTKRMEKIGFRREQGAALTTLSGIYGMMGNFDKVKEMAAHAYKLLREISELLASTNALNNIGAVDLMRGDYLAAKEVFQQTLEISRRINNLDHATQALDNLGTVAMNLGDLTEAAAHFEAALKLAETNSNLQNQTFSLQMLCQIACLQGNYERAEALAARALTIAVGADLGFDATGARFYYATSLSGQGKVAEARPVFETALADYRAMEVLHFAMEAQAGLADLDFREGNLAEAKRRVEEAFAYMSNPEAGGMGDPLNVLLVCYRVFKAEQDPRAVTAIDLAHTQLQQTLVNFASDEIREQAVNNVPRFREVIEIWRIEHPTGKNGGSA
ncbi:MAG: tetratricopeptide repeat protein [Anaerolineae bacterium]|nr:tetratricopeptide repeat protein [Anaerolineae bacterium]